MDARPKLEELNAVIAVIRPAVNDNASISYILAEYFTVRGVKHSNPMRNNYAFDPAQCRILARVDAKEPKEEFCRPEYPVVW